MTGWVFKFLVLDAERLLGDVVVAEFAESGLLRVPPALGIVVR